MQDHPLDAKNYIALDSSSVRVSRIRSLPWPKCYNIIESEIIVSVSSWKEHETFFGDFYQTPHHYLWFIFPSKRRHPINKNNYVCDPNYDQLLNRWLVFLGGFNVIHNKHSRSKDLGIMTIKNKCWIVLDLLYKTASLTTISILRLIYPSPSCYDQLSKQLFFSK
jgi:hypothetical protein